MLVFTDLPVDRCVDDCLSVSRADDQLDKVGVPSTEISSDEPDASTQETPTATENNEPESHPTTGATVEAAEHSKPASTITDLDKKEALGVFADQHLTQDEEEAVPKSKVFSAYEPWAERHGVEKVTKSWFARYLSDHIKFETDRWREDGEVVRHFVGFTLDREEESE